MYMTCITYGNTENVVYLLSNNLYPSQFQVFNYLESNVKRGTQIKVDKCLFFLSLLFFFGKVPGQLTEHLGGGHNVHTDLCCSDRISQRMLDDLKRDLETLNIVVRK